MSIEKGDAKYGSRQNAEDDFLCRQCGLTGTEDQLAQHTKNTGHKLTRRTNPDASKHSAAPYSPGGLSKTNCPKTGKAELADARGDGKFECLGCGAEISYSEVSNK